MALEICISFDGGELLFDRGIAGLISQQPGDLLAPFLDTDWDALKRLMDDAEISDGLFERDPLCTELRNQLSPLLWTCVVLPALAPLPAEGPMHEMNFALMKCLRNRFEEMGKFQKCLLPMVQAILEPQTQGELTVAHRHFSFRQTNAAAYAQLLALCTGIRIENRFAAGNQCFDFAEDADNSLALKASNTLPLRELTFFCTTDVKAVLLMELEHLCKQNLHLRRCAACGKYFVPHPDSAQYCERPTKDGFSCRETSEEPSKKTGKNGSRFFKRGH